MSFLKITVEKEGTAKKAGEAATECLRKHKNSKDPEILMLFSGGSAFKILDHLELENPEKTTIGVLDERFSKDPEVNNFSQLAKTDFFKKAVERGAKFIDSRVEDKETLPMLKEKFQSGILGWRKENPDGKIVATLGIGEDGHTAGVMPFPENPRLFKDLFEDKDSWVVGYDAGEKNPYSLRVTVSISFLKNAVDRALVFAVGEEKRETLEKVLSDEGEIYKTPGRVIQEMQDVCLFTDISLES